MHYSERCMQHTEHFSKTRKMLKLKLITNLLHCKIIITLQAQIKKFKIFGKKKKNARKNLSFGEPRKSGSLPRTKIHGGGILPVQWAEESLVSQFNEGKRRVKALASSGDIGEWEEAFQAPAIKWELCIGIAGFGRALRHSLFFLLFCTLH